MPMPDAPTRHQVKRDADQSSVHGLPGRLGTPATDSYFTSVELRCSVEATFARSTSNEPLSHTCHGPRSLWSVLPFYGRIPPRIRIDEDRVSNCVSARSPSTPGAILVYPSCKIAGGSRPTEKLGRALSTGTTASRSIGIGIIVQSYESRGRPWVRRHVTDRTGIGTSSRKRGMTWPSRQGSRASRERFTVRDDEKS